MDSPIMLLCTYGLSTSVVRVSFTTNFDNFACGHSKCMLESQTDFENMLILVCPLGLDRVDIAVSREGSNLDDDEENDEHSGVAIVYSSSRVGGSEGTSGLEDWK
ncbi:hypothetical protein RHMOL_Rhmol11G0129300 [Rhododendron molle]|uniref:Uncharacterized protein n=1 Tax=Rhododendron molle TaxID=49168 RepID=A0ACC0LRU1_RHOML|nr:hypothetical protein RHMOL_Rhmol11G0129300 [Rhododendron molle]